MSASLLQTFCPRDKERVQLVETSPRKPSQQEGCQVGGTNDAALLVRVAEVSQGRRVTDSDRRRRGSGFRTLRAAAAIGRPVVTSANGMLSQWWSMPCSLFWAAEGGLVFSDGVHLAGQDCCLGAGGGERAAGSLGVEGGFRGAPLGPAGQQR
jgi:hypothetical protein